MWIEEIGIITSVGNLDIWLEIVEIKGQEIELGREKDWNMDRGWQWRGITDKII